MITHIKKGFTLIELLVVITIIGILATGATAVYTSQIQKARDTTRINNLEAMKSWIEQFYQDASVYPNKWAAFTGVSVYTPKFPKDPKTGEASTDTSFDMAYNVWKDTNWIEFQEYEISTWFENAWTTTSKAGGDGGGDAKRLEFWIDLNTNDTRLIGKQTVVSWVATSPLVIPTATVCVTPNSATIAACDLLSAWTNVMVIR
ncbi:MAG: hypothetical protein ACD_2C00205G0007 [uncultured bacterium (gcode 4)]|uniref:Prepilin-type N-terminal cleavage/methylation domain-containing protein n=1 Tax=uncultured bacterium (gcode 4) TaxID=1234023 RepID=K2GFX5_9BACT|nr:MAG: hypothetical protein ACD_2C00205G0007 [uncultured bacterium (gcode 4)]